MPDLYGRSRHRWVANSDHYYAGNPGVGDMPDAPRVSWVTTPDPAVLRGIRSLHLYPSEAQVRRGTLPPYLRDLVNLHSLSMDATLLARVLPVVAPPMLVVHGHDRPAAPADLPPEVHGLLYLAGVPLHRVVSDAPGLRFLATDESPRVPRLVAGLHHLRHLELTRVGDLPPINAPIEALGLHRVRRSFPFTRLRTLETVEAVWLNGVRTDLDCADLAAMPRLRELTIYHARHLRNVTALLGSPTLRALSIAHCDRALHGVADRFHDHGFDRLSIDYA